MKFLVILAVLAALASFFTIDKDAAYYFAQHPVPGMEYVTLLGDSGWILALTLALWLFWRRRDAQKAKKALYVFASVLLSGLIVIIPKVLIGRARPKHLFNEGFYGFDPVALKASFWSMPSGHSATAFAFGVSLALLYPRYRYIFLALAALVAFSRVALTKHYPSDVIIGSLIGAAVAVWLYAKIRP